MSQFKRLFNSTRLPGEVKDTLSVQKPASHVAVLQYSASIGFSSL